jgi:hypothetical protein
MAFGVSKDITHSREYNHKIERIAQRQWNSSSQFITLIHSFIPFEKTARWFEFPISERHDE